jgi:aminoglycoside phosphotransferase (APT) family kinase protein
MEHPEALRARVETYFADLAQHVELFEPIADGHAGRSFALDLCGPGGARRRFVLKLGPAGVRRSGSTDIYRQSTLLNALSGTALPVPAIRWACDRDEPLGAPFVVMERLAGRSFIVWDPHPSLIEGDRGEAVWRQAAELLATLHDIDFLDHLEGWERPTGWPDEIARWTDLARHSQDASRRERIIALGDRLRALMPADEPVGLVHGDFQPGNILYASGKATGVIDWDLAAIGPQGIDVGWLMVMADAAAWHPAFRPAVPLSKDELLGIYRSRGGPAHANARWYQAFAHLRLGSIAGLNLKLHRNGTRVDPIWEKFELSMPSLIDAAFDMLRGEI